MDTQKPTHRAPLSHAEASTPSAVFFAILGESQANVRDDQRSERSRSKGAGEAAVPEYGVITQGYELAMRVATYLPVIGPRLKRQRNEQKIEEIQEAIESNGPTAVDRVEARQLEMLDSLTELFDGVKQGLESVTSRTSEIGEMIRSGHGAGGGRMAATGGALKTASSSTNASTNASTNGGPARSDTATAGVDDGLAQQVASMHAMLQTQQQQQERLTAAVAGLAAQIEVVVLGAKAKQRRSHHRSSPDMFYDTLPGGRGGSRPRRSPEERSELMEA